MWRLIHLLDGNLILFIEEDVNLWILGPGWRDGGHAPVWEVRQLTQLAQTLWISQDQPLLRIMIHESSIYLNTFSQHNILMNHAFVFTERNLTKYDFIRSSL